MIVLNELRRGHIPDRTVSSLALDSCRQASTTTCASCDVRNQCSFRHSSRNLPLKLSINAFWTGFPGWMKWSVTPC
jgi:hypothetical protein